MSKYTSFEDFPVYQDTLALTVEVFKLLKDETFKREYAIVDQVKRAVISISNNIAEGFERETDRELIRFLYIAKGSAGEVKNLFNVLVRLNLLDDINYQKFRNLILDISRQLANYIKHVKQRSSLQS